jgi:integrase
MDDLAAHWEAQLSAELAPSTRRQYEMAAKQVRAAFREFSPAEIRPTDVAQWMDHMRDKPNMANRCRTVLKLMMDVAVRRGDAEVNPVISIQPHKERKRDRYITDAEYSAVRAKCSPGIALIVDMCYLTAQRIQDVLDIKLGDITDEGITFQQGKTGKRILVSMSQAMADAITAAKQQASGNVRSIYLLPARGGKRRDYRTVRDAWTAACEKASVVDAHLHDLRAKSLTDADNQGINAQLLAGHANRQMTERYIRLRRTDVASSPTMGGKRSKSA